MCLNLSGFRKYKGRVELTRNPWFRSSCRYAGCALYCKKSCIGKCSEYLSCGRALMCSREVHHKRPISSQCEWHYSKQVFRQPIPDTYLPCDPGRHFSCFLIWKVCGYQALLGCPGLQYGHTAGAAGNHLRMGTPIHWARLRSLPAAWRADPLVLARCRSDEHFFFDYQDYSPLARNRCELRLFRGYWVYYGIMEYLSGPDTFCAVRDDPLFIAEEPPLGIPRKPTVGEMAR